MKKTYKITLPKGANISTVETNDNNGVLEVTVGFEKKYVPKDGDVLCGMGVIAIYAGTNENGGLKTYAALHDQSLQTAFCERGWGYTSHYRQLPKPRSNASSTRSPSKASGGTPRRSASRTCRGGGRRLALITI